MKRLQKAVEVSSTDLSESIVSKMGKGPFVVLHVKDYKLLCDLAEKAERPTEPGHDYQGKRFKYERSLIVRDAEIQSFVDENASKMIAGDLFRTCVERFGKDRMPSRTSLYRYLKERFGLVSK